MMRNLLNLIRKQNNLSPSKRFYTDLIDTIGFCKVLKNNQIESNKCELNSVLSKNTNSDQICSYLNSEYQNPNSNSNLPNPNPNSTPISSTSNNEELLEAMFIYNGSIIDDETENEKYELLLKMGDLYRYSNDRTKALKFYDEALNFIDSCENLTHHRSNLEDLINSIKFD